jgi:ABC-type dipeptide/oligopeptide/nickel transport system permease component
MTRLLIVARCSLANLHADVIYSYADPHIHYT